MLSRRPDGRVDDDFEILDTLHTQSDVDPQRKTEKDEREGGGETDLRSNHWSPSRNKKGRIIIVFKQDLSVNLIYPFWVKHG